MYAIRSYYARERRAAELIEPGNLVGKSNCHVDLRVVYRYADRAVVDGRQHQGLAHAVDTRRSKTVVPAPSAVQAV